MAKNGMEQNKRWLALPEMHRKGEGGERVKREWDEADYIKVGAVLTAAPRWVGALLAAEGFILPVEWHVWWVPLSAVLSATMAFVEGWAFSYVFEAWRNQKDSKSDKLLVMAIISASIFVVVLAPYIAAQVKGVSLAKMLYTDLWLYVWSFAVGMSTIAIVASVGYAQKQTASDGKQVRTKPQETANQEQAPQVAAQAPANADLTETQKAILNILQDNQTASNQYVAGQIGKSRETVRLARVELQQAGFLPPNGNHKGQG
jgi:uncharacterized membrane protein